MNRTSTNLLAFAAWLVIATPLFADNDASITIGPTNANFSTVTGLDPMGKPIPGATPTPDTGCTTSGYGKHTVSVLSVWEEGTSLALLGMLMQDSIVVAGCAYSPTTQFPMTQIMTVDSTGATKILASCSSNICTHTLPKAEMRKGSNDIWFLATAPNGATCGGTAQPTCAVTTKMSPPL